MPGLYYSSEFIVSDWRGRVHLLNLVRRATFLRRLKHWLSFPDRDTVTLRLGVQIQEVSTATKTATTPADVQKSQ